MKRMLSGAKGKQPLLFAMILASFWPSVLGALSEELPRVPADVLDRLPEEARDSLARLEAGLADTPDDPVLIGQIGMLLHAHDRLELAEQYYSRAHAEAPGAFEWGYYLAVVQSLQGKNLDAIAILQAIILPNDPYVPAQLKLGQLLFEANEWEESAKILRDVIERFPDLAVAHYALGKALSELGNIQDARARFERACEIYPKYGPAHYAAALAYRRLGDETKADVHFKLYKENRLTRPGVGDGYLEAINSLKAGSGLAFQHLAKAIKLGDGGKFAEAIEENLKALDADPGLLQAHMNLIILYGTTGDTEKAAEHYREAVAIDRNYPDAYYNYGVLLLKQERYLEAKEAFSEVLQIDPYHSLAHNNLGQILELEGSLKEALKHYEAACENDRTSRKAQFNRGRVLTSLNRFDEAIDAFMKTCEPEDEATAKYLYALGAAYVRSGDLENGLKYTEEARVLAERYQQESLVSAIERDLERLRRALKK